MPSSYSPGGDVSVLSSRIMPVPSSSRRSFSTSSTTNTPSSYTYRTIERPSYLSSVGATSSYLTSRPQFSSSDYKSSLLSDLKPSYTSGTYRSRYSGMSTASSSASTSSTSYSSSTYSRSSTQPDTDKRDSGFRSSRLKSTGSSTESYSSRSRLDGTSGSSALTGASESVSSTRSRFQRPSYTSDNDEIAGLTSRYKSSTLNNDSSTSTVRSRISASTQDCDEGKTTTTNENVSTSRPSVAEIRRMFDPVLAAEQAKPLEIATTTTTTTTKLDSDDESSSSSEEESSEDDTTSDSKNITRRSRIDSAAGLSADTKEKNGTCEESPSLSRRSKTTGSEKGGLVGLRNIGNTCFMNSVLQCLSNTRPLLEYLLAENYVSDLNTTSSAMKGALIKAFASLLMELWRNDSDERVVNTSSFKAQVQRFAPRFMGYAQQDAQEFLRYLLEGLHEDVNRVVTRPKPILTEIDDSLSDSQKATESWKRYLRRDDSKVVDIFVGQLRSTLRCTVCGHCSVTFDPFWDLSLPIPGGAGHHGQVQLSQCFDLFTKEEVLDGDEKPTCSRCQTRQKCTKSFSIHKFPGILVLHLKRFSPMERFRGKLGCIVDFPLTGLDLNAYASAGRGGGATQACSYNLYGVANHSGTTYSGHYIASCKHPYSGQWHEYNDSRVSSLPSRSVVTSEAYVLFYELTSSCSSHL